MQIAYTGDEALLTIGTGPDHGQFDLYINDNYWRRFDAYATTPAERVIHLPKVVKPDNEPTGKVAIKMRSDRHHRSTGRVFRFKQVQVLAATYHERTIDYTYDQLQRLQQANYDNGDRVYDYNFDLAGNRLAELLSGTGVTATNRYFGYNQANQLIAEGDTLDGNGDVIADYTYEYDANGNLRFKKDTRSNTLETYTWDRANRLKSLGTISYAYDGLGNRIQQTANSVVTDYLLDLQPGLVKVLRQSDGTNTNHFIHAVRGIHAQSDGTHWQYITQDGLGSVRSLINTTLGVDAVQSYSPYGVPDGNYAPGFGFTSEQTDANNLLFLRSRYYNPSLGVFNSRDPFEGTMDRPMSLNRYAYVGGNPIRFTDPSGLIFGIDLTDMVEDVEDFGKGVVRGAVDIIDDPFRDVFIDSRWSQTVRDHEDVAMIVAGGAAIALTGGLAWGAVGASGVSAIQSWPLWLKLGLLGSGSGFTAESISQAINNMNTCGMDAFNAFYRKNLDWESIFRSSTYGSLAGGILAVGGATTANALLGAGGYTLGTILYNRAVGNNPVEGITFENLALNTVSGGILGGLNQAVGGINVGGSVALRNAPRYLQAVGYSVVGFGVVTTQHLLTDDNPLESHEETSALSSGYLNAVSIVSGDLGVFLTLLTNAIITASGHSTDT